VERTRRIALLALLIVCFGCDVVTERHPTASAARHAKADVRGLLPAFVPANATDLKIAHDVDTDEVWIRCHVPSASLSAMTTKVKVTGWQEARYGTRAPSIVFGRWHRVLGESLHYTPEASSIYFVSNQPEWHGVVSETGECWIYGRPVV
jgi:hypothetical protein